MLSMWVVKERQKSKVMARLLSWAQDRILEPFTEGYRKQKETRFRVKQRACHWSC